ncbi:MAG: chromosome segregation protein SMC [Candidatus Zixiibacteriota bacterium]
MYLKRLELLGFKSFPDKTVIKLTPGVTSIVGPNGCGKTNILDAIRWVLGEQKVSLLRGSKMEEIIFNGTRDIKPLGMSEVTLVVQNNKGVLPTEYNDVQITRRLFRSGDSEYLLNKVPCRLKDITELFMDTGLGAHIYSVIQQDMIDAILSDRADDRRFLFEEASGISKYKNRKKAALRKLEATDGDLLRIKDIVTEISTQVNSLKRQMNKARRYKHLMDELKGWELYLGKNRLNELNGERRELKGKRDSLEDVKTKHDTTIDSISAGQEEQRKKLTDIDRQLTEIAEKIYRETENAHTCETDISVFRERRENAKSLKEKNHLDIEAYKQRRVILLEQIEETKVELSRLDNELNGISENLSKSEGQLTIADDLVINARKERDKLNNLLMGIEGRLSAGKSDDTNLKEQETDLNASLSEYKSQLEELGQNKTSLIEKQTTLSNRLESIKSDSNQAQGKKDSVESEINCLSNELKENSEKIFDLTAAIEAAEARLNLLEEMMTHYEGFSGGVVAVMENKEKWENLLGTAAESFHPKSGYEIAIEAALGETAGFMICKDRTTAENIIDYLRSNKKGKAGLLIADNSEGRSELTRPNIGSEGFLGWADNFVEFDENLGKLSDLLLSRVAVIKADKAEEIINQLPPYFSAVTEDGRLYHGKSIVTGGSIDEMSLLGRKDKIEAQKCVIGELNKNLDNIKEFRNSTTSMLGSKQADLNSLMVELETLKDNRDQTDKEIASVNFALQSVSNDINRIETAKRDISIKIETLRNRQLTLNLNFDQLAKEKSDIIKSLKEHNEQTEELERKSQEAESNYSNLQIQLIECKSKKQQLDSKISHTHELISEIDSSIAIKTDEIRRAENDITEGAGKIDELEHRLKEIYDIRQEQKDHQLEVRQKHSELQEELDKHDEEIKRLRKERDESGNQLHAIEIRITEIDSDIKSIRFNVEEQYKINIDEYSAEVPNAALPAEERQTRLQDLKASLRDFGGVNMMALEEYETATERQEFLTTQMEDLLNAKSTLQSTITKINHTARRLFMETFEKVRENFRNVFAELFTGGESDITLTDSDDPLESAIEIIARPRGKKLLSIAQMSGGERALTAISLLFAIYLAKPSPFCILDEIDAPLDDANIHRFLKIIRTFSEQTQFIIITHNKITMEAADNLYGITMEQPGVSRVVSVRFNDESEGKIINTDYQTDDDRNDGLPPAIAERLNQPVTISSTENEDN